VTSVGDSISDPTLNGRLHYNDIDNQFYTNYLITMTVHISYYESIKREPKRRLIYEYRCDERLKTKDEESTCLPDTGLLGELEHPKMKTRLIDEKFASVRGEFRRDKVNRRDVCECDG
jgi:hypothetical protein